MNESKIFLEEIEEEEGDLDIISELYDEEQELIDLRTGEQEAQNEVLLEDEVGSVEEVLEDMIVLETNKTSY